MTRINRLAGPRARRRKGKAEQLIETIPLPYGLNFNQAIDHLHDAAQATNAVIHHATRQQMVEDYNDAAAKLAAAFMKQTEQFTHSRLQSNKTMAGNCTQQAIKNLLERQGFLWRSAGVDGLITDPQTLKDVAAICVKRTLRERWKVELAYKNKWEKRGIFIPFCFVTHERDVTQETVDEMIDLGFHLFLPDEVVGQLTIHPNLHLRSALPEFLRSLMAKNLIAAAAS